MTAQPPVVKTWQLKTVQGVPYTLSVLGDGSLWLSFGTTGAITNAQLNPLDFSPAMSDVMATIAQVVEANAVCTQTKNLGAVTLVCDRTNGHSSFHHDAATMTYWLPDA